MIPDESSEEVLAQIRRLSTKERWPFYLEGQLELVRVAKKKATDMQHLTLTIDRICEEWERCPDSRELISALYREAHRNDPDPVSEKMARWKREFEEEQRRLNAEQTPKQDDTVQ